MKKVNKSKLNITIDIIMLMLMLPVAGIGLLMKYVLLPGCDRFDVYGKDVELFFWGIDRHQWGTIHLRLSYILLFFLVFHIVTHWKQIVLTIRKMLPSGVWRYGFAAFVGVFVVVLGIMPLFVKPEVRAHERQHHTIEHQVEEKMLVEVYGYMTLDEVAKKYDVSAEHLAKELHLAAGLTDKKLGFLKKKYGFNLNKVRDCVKQEYLAQHE